MAESHNSNADHFERADVVLEVADLRAGYGRVPVLHGVNLQIHEGEAVGIVGHNGMGKTTLLKVIMGLLPSSGGRIVLDGSEATGSPAHQRSQMGIGYVPQGRGILPGLTALENLRMAWREDIGETEEQSVERVVDQFPRLRVLLDRKGGSLSGGEQQILALAERPSTTRTGHVVGLENSCSSRLQQVVTKAQRRFRRAFRANQDGVPDPVAYQASEGRAGSQQCLEWRSQLELGIQGVLDEDRMARVNFCSEKPESTDNVHRNTIFYGQQCWLFQGVHCG